MNSYLMRLTQFMLLRERKCNESAEISKLRRWEFFYTGKEWKSRCDFCCCCCCFFPCCSLQEPDDFHVIFTKPLFFFIFVTSIHVQFIQKGETAFTQSQSQHSGSQPLLSITTQLQYLWELLLMERLFHCLPPPLPTSPYLPFSFVVLILFCGLILMKSLVVNRSGICRGL